VAGVFDGVSAAIDEAEFSMIFRANTTSTKAGSSIGYRWEWKNKGESTWQALSTWRNCKSSASAGATRTITGYPTLGAGYNKGTVQSQAADVQPGCSEDHDEAEEYELCDYQGQEIDVGGKPCLSLIWMGDHPDG